MVNSLQRAYSIHKCLQLFFFSRTVIHIIYVCLQSFSGHKGIYRSVTKRKIEFDWKFDVFHLFHSTYSFINKVEKSNNCIELKIDMSAIKRIEYPILLSTKRFPVEIQQQPSWRRHLMKIERPCSKSTRRKRKFQFFRQDLVKPVQIWNSRNNL